MEPGRQFDAQAYTEDLNQLKRAFEEGASDLEQRIKAFGNKHLVWERLSQIGDKSRLDPKRGIDEPLGLRLSGYRVYASLSTPWSLLDYARKLDAFQPAVESGAIGGADARRRAAGGFLSPVVALFKNYVAMEISTTKSGQKPEGLMVRITRGANGGESGPARIEAFSLSNYRPDRFSHFRQSKEDLSTGIVLEKDTYRVQTTDRSQRTQGYSTLFRLFSYVGELWAQGTQSNVF